MDDASCQLDRVVAPAGLFTPALTFSVVRDERGLYLICTGRAMGNVRAGGVAGAAAGAVLDKMADKRSVEIAQTESKLTELGPQALVGTKHSRFIARAAIKSIAINGGTQPNGWPVVAIHADKKVKLHFAGHDRAAVERLFAPLLPSG